MLIISEGESEDVKILIFVPQKIFALKSLGLAASNALNH